MPAADQSKAFAAASAGAEGVEGLEAGADESVEAGLGASQIVHFSVALAGLSKSHVEHFHFCPPEVVGAFMPAAVQLKPFIVRTGAEIGLNSKVGREAMGMESTALRTWTELGPAGYTGSFTGKVYLGSSSMSMASTSSFDVSLTFGGAGGKGTGAGANRDVMGGAGGIGGGAASALRTSTLSAW